MNPPLAPAGCPEASLSALGRVPAAARASSSGRHIADLDGGVADRDVAGTEGASGRGGREGVCQPDPGISRTFIGKLRPWADDSRSSKSAVGPLGGDLTLQLEVIRSASARAWNVAKSFPRQKLRVPPSTLRLGQAIFI